MAISEAVELSRGKIMKALVNSGKEFELEPENSWEPVKNFRQDISTIGLYDRSLWILYGEPLCVFLVKIHCRYIRRMWGSLR